MSYQQLYDATRFELTRQYLFHSDLPNHAIAERLGFADAAAFSNFVKRQSGFPPTEYVRRYR